MVICIRLLLISTIFLAAKLIACDMFLERPENLSKKLHEYREEKHGGTGFWREISPVSRPDPVKIGADTYEYWKKIGESNAEVFLVKNKDGKVCLMKKYSAEEDQHLMFLYDIGVTKYYEQLNDDRILAPKLIAYKEAAGKDDSEYIVKEYIPGILDSEIKSESVIGSVISRRDLGYIEDTLTGVQDRYQDAMKGCRTFFDEYATSKESPKNFYDVIFSEKEFIQNLISVGDACPRNLLFSFEKAYRWVLFDP